MTQKQFVVGLIEAELEQDEAQYQASHPEEQEDEGESDDQIENEAQEEAQDEFTPQEAQDGPDAGLEEQPAADQDAAPVGGFEAAHLSAFSTGPYPDQRCPVAVCDLSCVLYPGAAAVGL